MSADLIYVETPETERLTNEAPKLETGQWYWLTIDVEDEDDEETKTTRKIKLLTCITHVGSNYANLRTVFASEYRVHFDNFDDECERELDPDRHINGKIAAHQANVKGLLDQIQQLAAGLGILPRGALADESATEGSQALAAAHGTADIKAHKAALILAKETTLPDLFKQVEAEHKQLATWMKSKLIPMKAELSTLQDATGAIEDRIFTVELYAGLIEELEQIAGGKPTPNDTKVALFQRRHYMDEECLFNYRAGGTKPLRSPR